MSKTVNQVITTEKMNTNQPIVIQPQPSQAPGSPPTPYPQPTAGQQPYNQQAYNQQPYNQQPYYQHQPPTPYPQPTAGQQPYNQQPYTQQPYNQQPYYQPATTDQMCNQQPGFQTQHPQPTVMLYPMGPPPVGQWRQEISGCCNNRTVCLLGCFVPPALVAMTAKKVNKPGLLYGLISLFGYASSCAIINWCLVYDIRQAVRRIRNIPGSDGDDCLMSLCCNPCALCQAASEMDVMGRAGPTTPAAPGPALVTG